MKILHIYGQESYHEEAYIVGSRGVVGLLQAVEKALEKGIGQTPDNEDCVFVSDGEGYQVIILLEDGEPEQGSWPTLQKPYTLDWARDKRPNLRHPAELFHERQPRQQ